jgi:hypothetical protein
MSLSVLFSAAALLISGFSFIYLLGYLRRRTGSRRILEEFEEEVNKLVAGIDAAADRDITHLEDKSAAAKAMVETLDRRLAAYARELERREKQGAALDALASGHAQGNSQGMAQGMAQGARTEGAYTALGIRSSLRVDVPPVEPAPPVESAPSVESAPPAEPVPEDPSPPQSRFTHAANPVKPRASLSEQAQELSRNGFSPETIAVRLGVTVAEVNLALALGSR